MAGIKINNLDIDIIRAWKDEEYRNSLSEEQRSQLPENPAGMIELSDEDLGSVVGGYSESCCDCVKCTNINKVEPPELDTYLSVSEAGFVSRATFETFTEILEPGTDFWQP